MMKKQLLALWIALALVLMTGCAYLPAGVLTGMFTEPGEETVVTQPVPQVPDGDTVTITRAQYERYRQFDTILEMMDIVEDSYYQDVDPETMLQGAAAGLLDAIDDPYTFYYTPEEYAELWEEDEGEYAGVGIMISASYVTNICTITRVFEGGPAMAAGVRKGDILYKVGEDLIVTAETLSDAVAIMRGTPGTDVDVTFIRNGEEYTVTMTRATVTVNRIDSAMLDDRIGYIWLYEFAGNCAEEFAAALNGLMEKNLQGLIIDLRDNGGGWVEDARSIADLFLPAGTLCYLEYKSGDRDYYRTYTDGKEVSFPVVILVNENTASSSEILTGCMRDRYNALVVGTVSYGKGIVQGVMSVGSEGAGMQVTEAQYFTPNGNAVHKIGITPDVICEMPEDAPTMYDFGDLSDAQLKAAYDAMITLLDGEGAADAPDA